jgi:multidrug resistance efflux pump
MSNYITNPEDIQLNERQELLQFIGRPPSVFLRFGITAIGCVVVLFLAMSYYIKYPDVVTAKVVLTTENPPIRMLAKMGGRVSDIVVKNNDPVQVGQIIAVMDNTAHWRDVLKLEAQLKNNNVTIQQYQPLQLGALQNSYSIFT